MKLGVCVIHIHPSGIGYYMNSKILSLPSLCGANLMAANMMHETLRKTHISWPYLYEHIIVFIGFIILVLSVLFYFIIEAS